MLVFFFHGVNTRSSTYSNHLISNIKAELRCAEIKIEFYSSFWGNLFNNKKNQVIDFIKEDIRKAQSKHHIRRSLQNDFYRYREQRYEFINNFLGDFLIYQNSERGVQIRTTIAQQFFQFLDDHPGEQDIHFIAHSLGSLILWDLLFSKEFDSDDTVKELRQIVSTLNLESITTLGSPLLFLKQFLDVDFSEVNDFLQVRNLSVNHQYLLRWVNIIHSSDMIAYPLKASIQDEVPPNLFFNDQYVWVNANSTEVSLRTFGQTDAAMIAGAEDAHSSYFANNLDGRITAQIIARNLLGKISLLSEKCITSWDDSL